MNFILNENGSVTGKTCFDENGDCLKDAFIKEIKGGKWVSAEKLVAVANIRRP